MFLLTWWLLMYDICSMLVLWRSTGGRPTLNKLAYALIFFGDLRGPIPVPPLTVFIIPSIDTCWFLDSLSFIPAQIEFWGLLKLRLTTREEVSGLEPGVAEAAAMLSPGVPTVLRLNSGSLTLDSGDVTVGLMLINAEWSRFLRELLWGELSIELAVWSLF